MKKQLLCTSAIALGVAAAAPASAQDWDVSFGGFLTAGAGVADVSGSLTTGMDFDGLDVFQSGEIVFTPSVTMDNGLTFGINVQLEANTGGDQIDESYLYVKGDQLGTITMGSENSEGYRYMISTAGALQGGNMWITSPSVSSFVPFSLAVTSSGFRSAIISSFTEVGANNDAQRLSYRTPDFNGFSAGVSYARDGGQDDFSAAIDVADGTGVLHDIFDIGVGYKGNFGTTSIDLAARWGTGDNASLFTPLVPASAGPDGLDGTADDTARVAPTLTTGGTSETWGVAANLGFGDFSIVGSYAENDNPGTATDSSGWGLGVGYDVAGPWAFALDSYHGEIDAPGSQESYEAYKLNAVRDIGTGASLEIYAIQVDAENAVGADVEGTVLGAQVNLWF